MYFSIFPSCFVAAKANQKFPFHFLFRFAAEGWGEETRGKCKEIFGFAARYSARRGASSAIGAEDLGQSHHALRACEVSQGSAGNGFGLFDTMTTDMYPSSNRSFLWLERVIGSSPIPRTRYPVTTQ